jgi:tRNA pseudouridine55 synthase
MDGILNIHKPAGITSFGVVARVKRITGEKHCGHAGTLDPQATGVLPVCLGQATRVIEYLFAETKAYQAEIELGISTDTYDATGAILRTADFSQINQSMVEAALAGFRGEIIQTPPMFSAVKHQGKPLHRLARAGLVVERHNRPAQIHSLEIVAWTPPLITLNIVCGKGTYIRSIANDLGEALGCGAVMKNLVRQRVGPFTIEDALTLTALEKVFQDGLGERYLYPLDYVLQSFYAVVVDEQQELSLIHGAALNIETHQGCAPDISDHTLSRVYNLTGDFRGMIKYDSENRCWRPEKVFIKNGCLLNGKGIQK